jgi:FAD/FMN-containing dehydrogenase
MIASSNVSFAVRSGGHSPHHGFANTDNGILIDMSRFNTTSYDAGGATVRAGSGLTWRDLYTYLEPYQMTVVGGRHLDVGVAGLTLGGKRVSNVPSGTQPLPGLT